MMKIRHGFLMGCIVVCGILSLSLVSQAQTGPLRVSADQRGFNIGTAVAMKPFRNDAVYHQNLAREFNIIVAENAFKWVEVRPSKTAFNFQETDALVDFAQANHMKIRGHTLVWHNQLPGWLTGGDFTRDEVIEIMRQHILTLVGRYKGRVWAWDVVNEAIDEAGTGYRKDSFWYEKIGPEYIRMAFEIAREADPGARLYYNDYSIEGLDNKSNAVFNLVGDLKRQGVPVDGVGWQMHQENGFRIQAAHLANARRLADLGLELSMTEMDVRIPLPSTPEKLEQQARAYKDAIQFCLATASCKALVIWGFTDKYSWIPTTFAGQGDALIFDSNYQPKPAFAALNEVLEQGTDLAPKIYGAFRNGKQLILTGERFSDGAQIFINGKRQRKVLADPENPLTRLIAGTSGRIIKSGDRIQVKTSDGLASNRFVYP